MSYIGGGALQRLHHLDSLTSIRSRRHHRRLTLLPAAGALTGARAAALHFTRPRPAPLLAPGPRLSIRPRPAPSPVPPGRGSSHLHSFGGPASTPAHFTFRGRRLLHRRPGPHARGRRLLHRRPGRTFPPDSDASHVSPWSPSGREVTRLCPPSSLYCCSCTTLLVRDSFYPSPFKDSVDFGIQLPKLTMVSASMTLVCGH